METYDSPRDYRMALGADFGRARVRPSPGSCGMSPVILSARLMIAIDRGRPNRPWQDPSHDESTPQGIRPDHAAAAA